MINIHKNFIGGNIEVLNISDTQVTLKNEIRDTIDDWFYWAFCVEGAEGRTIKFKFDHENRVGYYGAAVSTDLINWTWSETADGESFTYTFGKNEKKVYFAHHMLYHPERFYSFAKKSNVKVKTLCKSEKGRDIPYITIGNGTKHIILTARHHACESTGNYVLEGVLQGLIANCIPGFSFFCVPFVDFDGVIDGDQGKNRTPYDHNRDYKPNFSPLYNSTASIRKYAKEHNTVLGFDFHSPWHKGAENDKIFIPQKSIEKQNKLNKFGEILENCYTNDALKYEHKNDIKPGESWNDADSTCFANYILSLTDSDIAFTLETAYFGKGNTKFSQDKAVNTGIYFFNALKKYIKNEF